jgi:vacuolar-type H+-ATPase subunit E/Vma4
MAKAKNRATKNGKQPETMEVPLTDRQVQMIQARLSERQQVLQQIDQQIGQMVDHMLAGHDVDFERVRNKAIDLGNRKVTLTLAHAE